MLIEQMRTIGVVFGILLWSMLSAQVDTMALKYERTITQEELKAHLTILASDEFEGRETGFKGQKKAAAYIVNYFKKLGLPGVSVDKPSMLANGYEQTFELFLNRPGGISLVADEKKHEFLKDLLYFKKVLNKDKVYDELVFAGYGLASQQHNDLKDIECDGCVVMVLDGAPMTKSGAPKLDIGTPTSTMQLMDIKSKAVGSKGAEVMLLVTDKIRNIRGQFGNFLRSSRMRLVEADEKEGAEGVQTIMISEDLADLLLRQGGSNLAREKRKLAKKGPRSRALTVKTSFVVSSKDSVLFSENVLGYIEGSDKKDELVIVTAHYDHVGIIDGEVYNGADDDGSGTVALLELAQAFAQAKDNGHGPRRSILFMAVSGEEKGLLGSEYYSENPIFPLENTIVDLNIDMIGRRDKEHNDSGAYVYIIGSDRLSNDLHTINEEMNDKYVDIDLDYKFNSTDDPNRFYYRSDHYNFARKGIPVIFYFSGVHDDYHQPGDDVERIEFDLLEKRAKLVFHTTWELANREQRIVVDGKTEEP